MTARVLTGDCLAVMPTLDAESVDAVVSDPPYGLAFMGKTWDHGVPGEPFWRAALRVAKPGAYLLAAGGTRTFHRLTCAIEDAGWEIHDCVAWMYGSGFPKHASKLKPAWEPFILARRPAPRATPLNIDACRIAGVMDGKWGGQQVTVGIGYNGADGVGFRTEQHPAGRWPANVVLDEAAAAMLDEQTGELTSGKPGHHRLGQNTGTALGAESRAPGTPMAGHGDAGGASRFFYVAKASRAEREAGLERHAPRAHGMSGGASAAAARGEAYDGAQTIGLNRVSRVRNHHPTVKPLDLMRWLVRLVTPPGGLVLDPFCGSGSTGCAAVVEGFRFVGIEQDAAYAEIARERIAAAAHHPAAMPLFAEPAA